MRLLAALVFCLLATLPVIAQTAAPPSDVDAAVREVVKKYMDAREKRDPALLAALFTEDADQMTTSGDWRRGRENVVKGGLASSQNNPGSRQIIVEAVRQLAPGVAIADGRYEIQTQGGDPPRRMWTTFVVMRNNAGAWRIAAIRNMVPTGAAR